MDGWMDLWMDGWIQGGREGGTASTIFPKTIDLSRGFCAFPGTAFFA